jgi:hypothetical protein
MASSRTANVAVVVFVVALAAASLGSITAAAAAAPPCVVRNVATNQVYRGSGSNLQQAIDEAGLGAILKVSGVCVGNFTVGRNLKLIGIPTVAHPTPTLNGNEAGTVLTLLHGWILVKDLTITGGSNDTGVGGGITVGAFGDKHRQHVNIAGSTTITNNVGGIRTWDFATVTMRDTSLVTGNTSAGFELFGGGVLNSFGTFTMLDDAQVSGNVSPTDQGDGGGIYNRGGTFVMAGDALVSNNTAAVGGGIYNAGTLSMSGNALVTGNSATNSTSGGGGIFGSQGTITLDGSASVTGNTAAVGGGIRNFATLNACSGPGSVWTGAISPNTPDDPPTPTSIAC